MKKIFYSVLVLAFFAISFTASGNSVKSLKFFEEAKEVLPITNNPIQEVKKAYTQVLNKYIAKGESNNHWEEYYFLHDVTGDDIPELWLQVNSGESFSIIAFTYRDGRCIQIFKGDLGAPDHIEYFKGRNYVLKTYFSMGYYSWKKYEYKNGEIKESLALEKYEDLDDVNAETPYPSEPSISCCRITDMQGINSLR